MITFREFVNSKSEDGNTIKVFFKDLKYSVKVPRYSTFQDRSTGWPRSTGEISNYEDISDYYTGDVIIPFSQEFLNELKNQGMTTREFLVYLLDLDNMNDLRQKFIDDMATNTFNTDNADFTGNIKYENIPDDLYDSVVNALEDKLSSGDYEVTNV
jgi:hypothetical protein